MTPEVKAQRSEWGCVGFAVTIFSLLVISILALWTDRQNRNVLLTFYLEVNQTGRYTANVYTHTHKQ